MLRCVGATKGAYNMEQANTHKSSKIEIYLLKLIR